MARLLAVAVTVVLALIAGPAQAVEPLAEGGCRTRTGGGWTIPVCSSDDGVYMTPDYYVDIRPPYTGTCQVQSYIYWSLTPFPLRGPETFSCTLNHGTGSPYYIRGNPPGIRYYHHIYVVINGSTVFSGRGPATVCC